MSFVRPPPAPGGGVAQLPVHGTISPGVEVAVRSVEAGGQGDDADGYQQHEPVRHCGPLWPHEQAGRLVALPSDGLARDVNGCAAEVTEYLAEERRTKVGAHAAVRHDRP